MSHTQPAQPQYGQAPPTYVPPQKKQKRFGWLALIGFGIVGLIVGVILGAVANDLTVTTASPAPTATRTITETPGVNTAPTEEPTKAPAKYNPKPADFEVAIKITEKQCFGSAGCIINFEPRLGIRGKIADLPKVGLTSITYEVTGGEDPFTDTLTMDGEGAVTGGGEQTIDTAGPSRKLTAKVTQVEYNEFG